LYENDVETYYVSSTRVLIVAFVTIKDRDQRKRHVMLVFDPPKMTQTFQVSSMTV
jgi:hypothetical protein